MNLTEKLMETYPGAVVRKELLHEVQFSSGTGLKKRRAPLANHGVGLKTA